MLDLKYVKENIELIEKNIENKNESADIGGFIPLTQKRSDIIQEGEKLKNTRNVVSKEIAALKKDKQNADEKILQMKKVSERIKELDEELRQNEEALQEILLTIPNMLHESVPIGNSESDNKIIRSWGEPKKEAGKNHLEIASELGILDFERGAKVSGSGFGYYTGKGATLERALINFFLDFNTRQSGYTEIMTPFIVGAEAMRGTGQIPKLAEDMYYIEKDGLYLIPTAEVPITNFHAKEMLAADELPLKYTGYSPCFRREAGSYGKETRGFLRVHQFNKVELVRITKSDNSYQELEDMLQDAENLLQALELPYRVSLLCSGDTSFASAKTYDLEVWAPGEQNWLEVSSISNFEDFQARRAMIRYKPTPKDKPLFAHTLNGSALATPRIMVALLENFYENGKVKIPQALQQYYNYSFV